MMTDARFYHSGKVIQATGTLLALSMFLTGCIGGVPSNLSVNSVHQPVVEHAALTMDVATGPQGLASGERDRLAGWFAAMNLSYGDHVSVDDPAGSLKTRHAVQSLLAHYGLMLAPDAPVTASYVGAGMARIIIIRSRASVPGCPDWSANSESNPRNGTSPNYGCAVNSNLAAMIANPDDLLRGQPGNVSASTLRNEKAIDAYSAAPTTGTKDLKGVSTTTGMGS